MSFTTWIMSITGAICISVFADILMAEGSTKKYVKGICALIVFAVIIAPFPQILNKDFDFKDILPEQESNQTFLADVNDMRYRNAESALESALSARGYKDASVSIYHNEVDGESYIYSVVVFIDITVINGDKGNINIKDDVTSFTAKALNVEEYNVIVVY